MVEPRSSSSVAPWPLVVGPVGLAAAILLVEIASPAAFYVHVPGPLLLTGVAVSTILGGLGSGLAASGIAMAYFLYYFSIPDQLFFYSAYNARHMTALMVASPAIALSVGLLRRRLIKNQLSSAPTVESATPEPAVAAPQSPDLDALFKEERVRFEAEIESLKKQLLVYESREEGEKDHVARFVKEHEQAMLDLQSLQKERDALKQAEKDARHLLDEKMAQFDRQKEEFRQESERLSGEKAGLERAHQEARAAFAEQERALEDRLTRAEQDARALREEAELARTNRSELEAPLADLQKSVRQKEEEVERLKGDLEGETERGRRMAEDLLNKDREIAEFIENASVGMYWLAADGKIIWANKTELDLLGYSREEYVGRPVAEFHADQSAVNDVLRRLHHDETLVNYELRMRCKDGSFKQVLLNANVARKDGQFVQAHCFTRDITDRKEFEEQLMARKRELEALTAELEKKNRELEESSQMKSNFVSIVSHELRTPLTVIMSSANNLMEGAFGPLSATQMKWLNKIHHHSNLLHEMISDILDLSKLEAGKMDLRFEKVDPARLIKSLVANMQVLTEGKELQLTHRLPETLPSMTADPGRLEQVLSNLLTNAIKFTPKGGSITVTARAVDDALEVEVADTGPGIAQEYHEIIFGRFKQIRRDDDDSGAIKGIGLGLTICKEIVAQHKGRIWVESEVGQGSRFLFRLPLEQRVETLEPQAVMERTQNHILVVDDDLDTCELLRMILSRRDYKVSVCNSVTDAMVRIHGKGQPVDLIFCDLMMPGASGLEIIKTVRKLGLDIPVVMVTAYPDSEQLYKAMEFSPVTIIAKPFNSDQVLETAARILSKKAAV